MLLLKGLKGSVSVIDIKQILANFGEQSDTMELTVFLLSGFFPFDCESFMYPRPKSRPTITLGYILFLLYGWRIVHLEWLFNLVICSVLFFYFQHKDDERSKFNHISQLPGPELPQQEIRLLISRSVLLITIPGKKGPSTFFLSPEGVELHRWNRWRLDTWTETLLLNLRRQLDKVQKDVWGLGFPVYS